MNVRHLTTTRRHGDLAVTAPRPGLDERRQAVAPGPWTWLTQVHGADVVTVSRPGEHAGARADAAVTAAPGAVLAVATADCAPVVLVADGAVGVAHAGWRGLEAGVVGAAVAALEALGHRPHRAVIGPCIRPARYEFGAADLERLVARWGPTVRGRTSDGATALDVAAAVRAALAGAGVDDVADDGTCTAADAERYWSHRARDETGRVATVAWLEG